MSKTPLEEFLDITELKSNPNYVQNLFKTAHSKNITLDDWNTFITQFQNLIARDADTYLGFNHVLSELQSHVNFINLINEDLRRLQTSKLDKVENPENTVLVYATQMNTQHLVRATHTDDYGTLMYRSKSTGQAKITTPTQPLHIANKEYVDDIAKTKLDIQTINDGRVWAYAISYNGKQMKREISSDAERKNTIMWRGENGQTNMVTPTAPTHVANKQYVDDAKTELNAKLSTVESIAKGANQALSFFNYEELVNQLNATAYETYNIGQNLYIHELNVPDLWIYTKAINCVEYTYTTDEDFIAALNNSPSGVIRVGHYFLAALETQKVDLTDYASKEYVDEAIGDVETVLDDIIAIQNSLIGGETV